MITIFLAKSLTKSPPITGEPPWGGAHRCFQF